MTLQFCCGPRVDWQSVILLKSPVVVIGESVTVRSISVFVRVTVLAPLVEPTTTSPKSMVLGEMVNKAKALFENSRNKGAAMHKTDFRLALADGAAFQV